MSGMRDAELALAVEAAGQWGMFTAAQATRLGMTRKRITQLCAADRIHHTDTRAVYRFAGTPTDITLDAVRATWLALEPSHFAGERLDALRAGTPGPLASHLTAAHYLYELGTLQPDHLDYTVPTPRRTNNPWIRFHVPRQWPPWRLVAGIPTTTIAQTIADLYADGIDAGHLGDILRDTLTRALTNITDLTDALDPLTNGAGRDTIEHALTVVGAPAHLIAANELLFTGR
ncbi:hypothetical protein ACNUDN_29125 [Mycobacterium sp. smrl_JER01]|uniref:AbiEi antitoxin C-terminal domain-containing protein n=2 Tax=Mycobacteriaceae TaxID=1762 RepID=A0A1Y0CGS0_9MYCO|nr:hypothetical protein [Mycobacterium dioxanotrophicus]ART74489.1 hypothetical protein BTO20_38490 [Mycobacterium dioxanotrophicus]